MWRLLSHCAPIVWVQAAPGGDDGGAGGGSCGGGGGGDGSDTPSTPKIHVRWCFTLEKTPGASACAQPALQLETPTTMGR